MKKDRFQECALGRIREELAGGSMPLDRIRAFAAAAVDLGAAHPEEIPAEALAAALAAYPEFASLAEEA
ncbi:MAG: hypothetical protein RL272_722 [Candidatus Parcubacteria bacterium]|jgi:hypothetical protein